MTQKQDRLLKQYEQWNSQQFKRIYRLWEQKFSRSSTLEEFLAYLAEDDVMDVEEYSAKINNIIDVDLNQLSFNRKAQFNRTKATIHNNTFDLVKNVNDDFKEHLRTQAVEAFEKGVSPQEFGKMIQAPPLVKGVDGAKRSVSAEVRNRMIARTEAKRALNASNLIINKERGATHWYAIGFTDEVTCTRCIETYGTPGDYKYYSIEDTKYLPPLHPNCRHTAVFVKEGQLPEGADIVGGTTTTETTTTTEPVTETTSNSIFQGKPTVHTERDRENGSQVTVYRYENGFELAISQNADFTFEDIVSHIESLPEPLKNINTLKRINIKDYLTKDIAGEYDDNGKFINLYQNNKGSKALDTLTHELAHALDASQKKKKNFHLSVVEVYEKIFKADNKLYAYVNERTGRKRSVKKFPTDYAKRSYVKFKKQFDKKLKIAKKGTLDTDLLINKTFVEDFAESTKRYLNPKTHSQFVKDFPNRAEYLESIYGKPIFDKDSPLSKLIAEEDKQLRQMEQAEKESEIRTERFNQLTKKQLDIELEKVLGDKEKVKAYHAMVKEVEKLESVQKAIMFHDDLPSRIKVLTDAGWSESMAKNIAQNPNDYLSKVNAKKRKYKEVLEKTEQIVKDNLDLTQQVVEPEPEVKKPKQEPKHGPEEKPSKPKKETKPKEENVDPVTRGKIKNITYEDYEGFGYRGPKVIEYEDGTTVKFKKHGTPEYPGQTLDEITINGKTIKYDSDKEVHRHFEYQDKQLTADELKFADEFIDKYGTYAGKSFNNHERGIITDDDLEAVKDDEAFKWLMANKDKYNKILEKSVIEEDILTMRIQAENYLPKGAKTIKDKGLTSSSAAASRSNLIEFFGNGRDIDKNWTFITVTPAGTKGARFQGNSVARNYGDIEDDFEMEITYKQNMEFDILLQDDKNKIIILQPKRR